MYRAHSERMMESINKFHFVEVRNFFSTSYPPICDLIVNFFFNHFISLQVPCLFKHFWQELPEHIVSFVGQKSIVYLIGVCDQVVYNAILKAVLPTPLKVS